VPAILPSGRHRLIGRGAALHDLAGLPLADSLVSLQVEVLDPADLGRIEGRLSEGESGAAVVCAEGRGKKVCTTTTERAFSLTGLPPGEYLVHAFVDRDGDGARGPGQLAPFARSEPYGRVPGPVTVPRGGAATTVEVWCR
jgi:hypothetical protein